MVFLQIIRSFLLLDIKIIERSIKISQIVMYNTDHTEET